MSHYAREFVHFLNESPTPYHVVQSLKKQLTSSGFRELRESEDWGRKIQLGDKYYVTRNESSLIAFAIGGRWAPGNPIAITGAHTDSPVLRVKPISKRSQEGYLQVGVECYGGGIWHTWFDKDLALAGRVFVENSQGETVSKLVNLKRPLLKIPTLAIHLDRAVNEKFEFNKEAQLLPVAGLADSNSNNAEPNKSSGFESLKSIVERHHEDLLDLVAQDLQLNSVNQIVDFELILYDHENATLGGIHDEFVFSGRLDNSTSCFTSLYGLIDSCKESQSLLEDEGIRLMACFDHEEIGSQTGQGADSTFLPNVLNRLNQFTGKTQESQVLATQTALMRSCANSFFLSSDVGHAVHPNYASKYESNHKPHINKGPIIKINANQRYMTNSPGIVLIKKIADRAKVPLQLFVVANDSSCGSTIGPILASKTGIRTLDIGNPVLSMHSIREMGGSDDIRLQIALFEEFFKTYSSTHSKIKI